MTSSVPKQLCACGEPDKRGTHGPTICEHYPGVGGHMLTSNKRSFERVPITPANMPTLADYDAALVEVERLREENQSLRNLAANLRPGPISQALQDSPDYSGQAIERLREALEDAADMLHECALECSDCDYGDGATGKGSEGGVCEECAPIREGERRAREVLSGDSSAPETKAQPDTNKNRIVLELRDRAGQCYRHDDGLADLLLRAAEWINRLQLPQVETAALSEAETLLQAWADLLPPNGKLYWQHVEKAREYFRRRGLTQETKPECICPRRDTDDAIIYTHLACPTHGTLSQKASVDRQIQPPTPCTGCEGKPEFPNIPCSICGMYPDGTSV